MTSSVTMLGAQQPVTRPEHDCMTEGVMSSLPQAANTTGSSVGCNGEEHRRVCRQGKHKRVGRLQELN